MDIRPSPIAGLWYPGDESGLRQLVDYFLSRAKVEAPNGKVWGVVAPHAGLRYSGQVAAHAFCVLQGNHPDLVVVISPSHNYHPDPVLTSGHEAYSTPLGVVPVDRDAQAAVDAALRERFGAGLTPVRRDQEHAVEIELPFLQRVLGSFQLLPIMLRAQGVRTAQALGEALADTLADRNVLFVASSDLSHFYPRDVARTLDTNMLNRVAAFDPEGVIQLEDKGLGFACGRGAIATVLWAARRLGADHAKVLAYGTSGDVTGDFDSVVGYGAAVIWQANGVGPKEVHHEHSDA